MFEGIGRTGEMVGDIEPYLRLAPIVGRQIAPLDILHDALIDRPGIPGLKLFCPRLALRLFLALGALPPFAAQTLGQPPGRIFHFGGLGFEQAEGFFNFRQTVPQSQGIEFVTGHPRPLQKTANFPRIGI